MLEYVWDGEIQASWDIRDSNPDENSRVRQQSLTLSHGQCELKIEFLRVYQPR